MRLSHRNGAFTLIELLVVVAIIVMLAGILIPSLGQARAAAKQVKSQSDLRQILTGYAMYHQENNGSVLMGYPPANLLDGFYEPRLERRYTGLMANLIARRYPWRIVPYVQNVWQILHSHEVMPPLPSPSDSDSEVLSKAYELSLYPTFGMNTAYVGGDTDTGGYQGTPTYSPIIGSHVVYKASEVRRPGELIVFAHSRKYSDIDPDHSGKVGHYLLHAPRANGIQWHVADNRIIPDDTSSSIGIPQGWYKNDVVVGFFDSHVESLAPRNLEDMRLWANNAGSPTYDFVP